MSSNILSPVPPLRFPARRLPPQPWPFAPVLELPAGDVRNEDCGRVITAMNFVLAVGLSPKHYVAVARAPGTGAIIVVLEQLVGFLCAHGATVLRLPVRCPTFWFHHELGGIEWKRCLVFFARLFLSHDPTEPPWVPPHILQVVPVSVMAKGGFAHWAEVQQVLEGVEAADPDLLLELGGALGVMARRWEYYTARQTLLAARFGGYDDDDRSAVVETDHLLYRIMTKYESSYEFLPITIARLL